MTREQGPVHPSNDPNVVDFTSNPNVVHLESVRQKAKNERKPNILQGLVNVGLFSVAITAIGGLWIYSESRDGKPTGDQSVALRKFESSPEEFKVHNLTVGSEGVNLRNRPFTEGSVVGDSGDVVGELGSGTAIESAIKVLGNDDDAPWVRDMHDTWYAFPNPENPDQIVFVNSELIHAPDEAELVPLTDLDK